MSTQPLHIYHATTVSAVPHILKHGFDAGRVDDLLNRVAQAHGTTAEAIREESRQQGSFLHVDQRDERVSFTNDPNAACYVWAQQAPEAARMALWSVWRMRNPGRTQRWQTDVEGHVWVKAHLACDAPVVFEVPVDYSELLEWGATDGGFQVTSTLSDYSILTDPSFSHPEISMPPGLFIPEAELTVHDVASLIEWDEVAHLLGYEPGDFVSRAKAGQFGKHGTMPNKLVTKTETRGWWTLEALTALRAAHDPGQLRAVECECSNLHPTFTTISNSRPTVLELRSPRTGLPSMR